MATPPVDNTKKELVSPDNQKNVGKSPNDQQSVFYGEKIPTFSQPIAWFLYQIDQAAREGAYIINNVEEALAKRTQRRNISLIVAGAALVLAVIVMVVAMPILAKMGLAVVLLALVIGGATYGYFNHKAAQGLQNKLDPSSEK